MLSKHKCDIYFSVVRNNKKTIDKNDLKEKTFT